MSKDGPFNLLGDLELFNMQIGDDSGSCNLEQDERDGPVTVLRPTTLALLSTMLNPIKVIPADSGLPRDWRGLAELAGLASENITYLEDKSDHFQDLLKLLPTVTSSRLKTVKDLKAFLTIIDRYDVVDDGESLMESDVAFYHERANQLNSNSSKSPTALSATNDKDLLTYGDISGKLAHYDAFLLNSDEDNEFAEEVVRKLETDYKLKLCVKERDLLPGVMFEHEAIGKLIEQRCNRLLVILSPSFLESEGNKFLVSYTQALALESRQRKIIPCMYKRCERPLSVRYSYCLDYTRAGTLWNFWEKLSNSIATSPIVPTNQLNETETTISSLTTSKTGTSLPDNTDWDPRKVETLSSTLGGMSISSPPQDQPLSSSMPKYSKTSKKWYMKVISTSKKKKDVDKKGGKKLLATAN